MFLIYRLVSSICMVPIHFIIPICMYFAVKYEINGSMKAAVQDIGMLNVAMQVFMVLCSFVFTGMGTYSAIKEFAS